MTLDKNLGMVAYERYRLSVGWVCVKNGQWLLFRDIVIILTTGLSRRQIMLYNH